MNRKPRVAVIGLKGLPAFGGAAAVGERLIKNLQKNYDFTVLSVASHTSVNNREVEGIPQIIFQNYGKGALNTLLYYLKSLFHVLTHSYDFIHLHHAESGFITPFLKLRYKIIVTFHGIYNYKDPKFSRLHNWFFRFSERLNVKFADQVVSVSLPDSSYIRKKYGREIHYIPNGINLKGENHSVPDKNQQSDYIFFAAGRIYEIKGLHLLLTAMKQGKLDISLKIAGDVNQVPQYRSKIEELSKDLDVTFLGLIKEKPQLMQLVSDAKLFVFPSLTEAMSMMLLEVVSMKTPVIASDIPSNKSIFSDEELLFFKSNDSIDLMEKLQYAIKHPGIMKEKAEKAFEKLSSNYTWDNIARQYDFLYQKLNY